MNISWYLTSLKDLDEAEERIDIYAMISIRWCLDSDDTTLALAL